MGSGERHGRRRAGHAHRHRRAHRHHHHHRANIAHHHRHRNHFQGRLFWGGAARQRNQAAGNTSSNTNTSNTNTFVGFYAASTTPPFSRSTLQHLSMCRIVSIFFWFVGIMMMSLGGFRTRVGFIGLGLLIIGVVFLVLTSLLMSGRCSNYCIATDPERLSSGGITTNGNNIPNQDVSSGISPPLATFYGDPAPTDASPDPAMDKPPSYEEVMEGRYPVTVSATILATIPEGAAPTLMPPVAELSTNGSTVLPYPSNTLHAETLGWSVAQPYPPADRPSFQQTGSGNNYILDAAYPQVSQHTAPPHELLVESGLETDTTLQAPRNDSHPTELLTTEMQVVNEYSGDSIQTNVNPSSHAIPLGAATPSADTLPAVQVESLHESPIPGMDSQTLLPLGEQSMDLSTSVNDSVNVLSSDLMVESSVVQEEEEAEVGDIDDEAGTAGTEDKQSSTHISSPQISSTLTVITQSQC